MYALHGFLGLPSDWDFMQPKHPINLWTTEITPFEQWARTFNEWADPGILMGYSLGGRLALHCLIESPSQWRAAIIISAHPGLKKGKKKRIEHDRQWADHFAKKNWANLIHEWNQQGSLKEVELERNEEDFDRKQLVEALDVWSLGRQNDLRAEIEKLPMPILWMAGEEDRKFVRLAKEVKLSHPKSQVIIVPKCGHRISWQKQELFLNEIKNFLHTIGEPHDSSIGANVAEH